MTTLLEIVNKVLMKIGEGRVSTVNQNITSRLCAENVITSILALVDESNEWPWLKQVYNAASWSGDTATLPGTAIDIQFVRDNGRYAIVQYMSPTAFSLREPLAYTGANGGAQWWTFEGEDVRFDPYPDDAAARDNIFFHGSIVFTLPALDADVLQVPDRDINMLVFRACMMMAIDHMRDSQSAEMYLMEYQKAVQMAKSRMTGDAADRRRSAIW